MENEYKKLYTFNESFGLKDEKILKSDVRFIDKKYKMIQELNKKTYGALEDYQEILFYVKYEKEGTPFQIINNNGKLEDDYNDILIKDNIKYYNYVEYPNYFIKIQNGTEEPVMESEKIIFQASYIKLLFNYPILNEVIFTIRANDEEKGFTSKELINKVIKYYNLIIDINYNYDINKGKMDTNKGSDIFDWSWKEIFNNGITGLQYIKKRDLWEVRFSDYL